MSNHSYKTPYWYQQEAINAIFKHNFKVGNALVVQPPGSGKSVVIGCFCEQTIKRWPAQKLLILSDNQDILSQDYDAIKAQLPATKIGLYSQGLKSSTIHNITVAGIQSIYNKPELFKAFNFFIIDEAHKVPYKRTGRYHKFFEENPKPSLGLTATPFRMECGLLTSGKTPFFKKIIYSTDMKVLVKEKKLSPFVVKETKAKMDTTGIKKVAGEFSLSALSLRFDREAVTDLILDEVTTYYPFRKRILLYAIDTTHADHIAEGMTKRGILTKALHSNSKNNREATLQAFKKNQFPALVSVAMLTTGINIPDIDLIVLIRPTSSLTLHIQIIGRGDRLAEGKENCLVLDFAGNFHRNGPVDEPVIRENYQAKKKNEPIMKTCPECFEIVPIATRKCPECKFNFPFRHNLSPIPSVVSPLSSKETAWYTVQKVRYSKQLSKNGNIPMLVVTYQCGFKFFKEYVCLEHQNIARQIAENWWLVRNRKHIPATVDEALKAVDRLPKPQQIFVNSSFRYPQIKKYKF